MQYLQACNASCGFDHLAGCAGWACHSLSFYVPSLQEPTAMVATVCCLSIQATDCISAGPSCTLWRSWQRRQLACCMRSRGCWLSQHRPRLHPGWQTGVPALQVPGLGGRCAHHSGLGPGAAALPLDAGARGAPVAAAPSQHSAAAVWHCQQHSPAALSVLAQLRSHRAIILRVGVPYQHR